MWTPGSSLTLYCLTDYTVLRPQDDVIAGLRATSKNMQRSQATLKSPMPTRTPPFSPRSPLHNSSTKSFGEPQVAAAAAFLAAAAAAGSPHTPVTARRYSGTSAAAAAAAAAGTASGSRSDGDEETAAEELLERARVATGSSRGRKGGRGASALAAMAAAAAAAAAEDSGGSEQGRGRDRELSELLASVGRRAAVRGKATGKESVHVGGWHHAHSVPCHACSIQS
jgi:hypothetical protein